MDISSGFSLGNDPAVAPNSFFKPNNWRQAATIVETGFHSAKYWRNFGIPVVGAKAFDKKVSGKTAMKVTFCATRSSFTDKPISTPIQDMA